MHQTLQCLSCEATIRPPDGRVARVTRCPWCGADPRAAPPEPLPPEEIPEPVDSDNDLDEPVLIPEEAEPYVVSGAARRDPPPRPAPRSPAEDDGPKLVDVTGPVVAAGILFVSFLLAVAGFFVARYLAMPGPAS
jgi:hypothetical protein